MQALWLNRLLVVLTALVTQVMAAGMLALCQTCKWLGGNTTEDARKLAEDFGRLSKAPTDDGDKEGDSSDDEDDKGQEEGGELQDGDDDEAAKGVLLLFCKKRGRKPTGWPHI
jgi:hypothetical protein